MEDLKYSFLSASGVDSGTAARRPRATSETIEEPEKAMRTDSASGSVRSSYNWQTDPETVLGRHHIGNTDDKSTPVAKLMRNPQGYEAFVIYA